MNVLWDGAVCIEDGKERLYLDPKRKRPQAVVTHAHLDHLIDCAVMTHPTKDVLCARMAGDECLAVPARYREKTDIGPFCVLLEDAGHVLGSAMVRVGDILYTGDFDTNMGITCGAAEPQDCDRLIVEATYGDPRFALPDQQTVRGDLLAWMEDGLENGPLVVGSYEFGKAQDLIALANSIGAPVVVPDTMAPICEVYRSHGVPLSFTSDSLASSDLRKSPHVYVTSRKAIKRPLAGSVQSYRKNGARIAHISGWSAFWNYTNSYDIDVQFPLSNHADFPRILDFVKACRPREVFTVHGSSDSLAGEIEKRLNIPARALERATGQCIAVGAGQ